MPSRLVDFVDSDSTKRKKSSQQGMWHNGPLLNAARLVITLISNSKFNLSRFLGFKGSLACQKNVEVVRAGGEKL